VLGAFTEHAAAFDFLMMHFHLSGVLTSNTGCLSSPGVRDTARRPWEACPWTNTMSWLTRRHVASWEWEIYRNSEPLPARLRDGPYKSVRTTEAVGSVAPREFLQGLSREKKLSLAVNPAPPRRLPRALLTLAQPRARSAVVRVNENDAGVFERALNRFDGAGPH
jgi:hypothetical protein